jgi:hypothetical protein
MKGKRKLTKEQKEQKRKCKQEFMIIFVRGKQKRVKRYLPLLIDGMPVDEFVAKNADPLFYHQNEEWELLLSDEYT